MNKSELILIKKALLDVEKYEIKRLESFPHVDSSKYPEYDKHIELIIATEERKNSNVHIPPKKLIAILVAAALLLSTAITVFAYHEPIFSFFEEIFEKFTRFSSIEDEATPEPIQEEGVYLPTYLPTGFEQTNFVEKESLIQTIWTGENDRIILKQNILHNINITLDTEENDYEKIHVDNTVFYYTVKNNVHQLLWSNTKYSFTLWCTSGITREEAIKIAQSLTVQSQ